MKFLKIKFGHAHLIFLLILMLTACSKDRQSNDGNMTTQNGEQLFEGVFFWLWKVCKGTFYPQLIEIVEKFTPEQRNISEANFKKLEEAIKLNKPRYFEDFKISLMTRNHNIISNAVNQGFDLINENIKVIFPKMENIINSIKEDIRIGKLNPAYFEENKIQSALKKSKLQIINKDLIYQNMISNEGGQAPLTIDTDDPLVACSWAVVCVYYAALAIHNTIAITGNVAVALSVYLKVGFWGPNLSSYKGGGVDVPIGPMDLDTLIRDTAIVYGPIQPVLTNPTLEFETFIDNIATAA